MKVMIMMMVLMVLMMIMTVMTVGETVPVLVGVRNITNGATAVARDARQTQ
jgi:type IV secretory pathway component VirB8